MNIDRDGLLSIIRRLSAAGELLDLRTGGSKGSAVTDFYRLLSGGDCDDDALEALGDVGLLDLVDEE